MDAFDKKSDFCFSFAWFSVQKEFFFLSPLFKQIQNDFVHLFAFVLVGISNIHYLTFYCFFFFPLVLLIFGSMKWTRTWIMSTLSEPYKWAENETHFPTLQGFCT